MAFTFASWNINSIRARAHLVQEWFERNPSCDLLCLQEIKCEDHQFPTVFAEAGLHVATSGQKAYNGVALIGRRPFEVTTHNLPGFEHPSARYIEAKMDDVTIGNLYLPNGNSGGEEGYATKLAFFDALTLRARQFLAEEREFAFIGDYNVCPTDEDLAPNALSATDALVRPQTRAAFRRLLWTGLTDGLRALRPEGRHYTFWDYQAAAFQRNSGLRIDHALLSPRLAQRLTDIQIDRDERAREKASDHVPLIVTV
ncbi:exodeoxyribonuclease III [Gluconobacter wancherniae]|uniref:exodeoxyribonuclease III n=1 Tax=Gluconobacter wancherniae TaxID=1307955 RepID=UPI001B8B27A7|nr:exodeoxyribonuclease III [Gluconobacter wancherniae]MBS1061845.1 exodeoxyribonuclease III [Gluconobacter wancherniae]